jgi:hypothetical protein
LAFIDDNEKLVVVILFNNGGSDGGANSATASVASGQDVDGFHGQRMVMKERKKWPASLAAARKA